MGKFVAIVVNVIGAALNVYMYNKSGNDVSLFIGGVNAGIAVMILALATFR